MDRPSQPTLREAPPTVLEGGAALPAGGATVLEGRPGAEGAGGECLQAGARLEGYELVAPLKVASAEADIWRIRDLDSGTECILKLYRYGITPKPEIAQALQRLRREEVVAVLRTGVAYGRHFEVQEFLPLGSLADQVRAGQVTAADARAVLDEMARALSHLHAANVLHRDIKPANILVRALKPLDIILTDFGISSLTDLSLHLTTVNRTAAYSAPEALTGVVAKASDWWSLGVVLLELVTGRHPFAGLTEQAVNFQLVTRGIPVPDDLEPEWRLLLRGLLTREHRHRWGAEEVEAWLAGRRDLKVHVTPELVDAAGHARPYRMHRPYRFCGADHDDPAALAAALAANWAEAVKHFGRGLITDWVKTQLYDQDLASTLLDVAQEKNLDAEQKLSVALLALHPEMPLVFRSEIINPDWFTQHPEEGLRLLHSGIPRWYERLRRDDWLRALRQRRREGREFLDAAEVNVDLGTASILLLSEPERVIDTAKRRRAQFVSATHPRLSVLLDREELSFFEAVLLLSVESRYLLTQEQAQLRRLDELRREIATRLEAHHIAYSPEKLNEFLLKPGEEVMDQARRRQKAYGRATRPMLERLLLKKDLAQAEAILLAVADAGQLLDEARARVFDQSLERERTLDAFRECGIDLDWPLLERLLDDPGAVPDLLRSHRHRYVRATHPRLQAIFAEPEPELDDALLLVAAQHRYFLTPVQAVVAGCGQGLRRVLGVCQAYPIGVALGGVAFFLVAILVLPPIIVTPLAVLYAGVYIFAAILAPPDNDGQAG